MMNLKKKYIVTGGAGFIGSHLVERLIKDKHEVFIIDDLSSGFKSNLPKELIDGMLISRIQDVSKDQIISSDGIFHLAAQASVPISINDFFNSSNNNILGTLKVFDWARSEKIPIVYASSSAVYGNLPLGDDLKEDYDILSPYAQDKLTMEQYALLLFKIYKVKSLGLRFFNVYGPKQDPKNPYSGVISIFIEKILCGEPVTINGGYQVRDFIYINDIVDVLIKSMNLLHNKNICNYCNVGTGVTVSIDELLLSLKNITKANPKIIRKDLPEGDPELSSGTYEKINSLLNIDINSFCDLESGLEKTFNYFNKEKLE
jgi:UDP-glucose 4-epimerase